MPIVVVKQRHCGSCLPGSIPLAMRMLSCANRLGQTCSAEVGRYRFGSGLRLHLFQPNQAEQLNDSLGMDSSYASMH